MIIGLNEYADYMHVMRPYVVKQRIRDDEKWMSNLTGNHVCRPVPISPSRYPCPR